jgi:hypothetical protein
MGLVLILLIAMTGILALRSSRWFLLTLLAAVLIASVGYFAAARVHRVDQARADAQMLDDFTAARSHRLEHESRPPAPPHPPGRHDSLEGNRFGGPAAWPEKPVAGNPGEVFRTTMAMGPITVFVLMFVGLLITALINVRTRKVLLPFLVTMMFIYLGCLFAAVRFESRQKPVVQQARMQTLQELAVQNALRYEHVQSLEESVSDSQIPIEASAWPEPPMPPMAEFVEQGGSPTESVAGAAGALNTPGSADATGASSYVVFEGNHSDGVGSAEPPAWLDDPVSKNEAGTVTQTLSSERFATLAQAEEQLWNHARRLAAEDLWASVPEAKGWLPSREFLERAEVVLDRCVEQTALSVGTFTEPMYRVHWRLSFPPSFDTALARDWQPEFMQGRALFLAGALGALTLLFGVLNLLLRGAGSLAKFSRRRTVATGAIGLIVLLGLGVLIA